MKYSGLIALIIIILISIFSILVGIFGDWFWFASIGYESVFITILGTSIWMGLLFFLGFVVFSFLNIRIAKRVSMKKSKGKAHKQKSAGSVFYIFATIIGLFVGMVFSNWEVLMKFLNPSSFGVMDPVFGLDIGFYVFTLPFYGLMLSYLAAIIIPTMILTWGAHIYYSMPSRPSRSTDDMGIDDHE